MSSVTTVPGSVLRLNSYLNTNNILGYAVKNYRDRFLIPRSQNVFGGLQIKYVIIDSGSNSSLLSLPMTSEATFDVHQLIKCFPCAQCSWAIGTAADVGLISDTTLHIKPIEENDLSSVKIKCHLHTDIKPLDFELPYVRFSLDTESMKILAETTEVSLSDTDKETIENTLKFLNDFEQYFPPMISKKKHDYCLLGQQFLKSVCTIQMNDTMLFVDKDKIRQKLFPPPNVAMNEIVNYLYYQRPAFTKSEKFLTCENDMYHGEHDLFDISDNQIDIDEFYN